MVKIILIILVTNLMVGGFFYKKKEEALREHVEDKIGEIRDVKEIAKNSFNLGCQIGFSKQAKYKELDQRFIFCDEFLRKNPEVMDVLIKKA